MNGLSKNAHIFIDGVLSQLKTRKATLRTMPKVKKILRAISEESERNSIAHILTAIPLGSEEKNEIEKIISRHVGRPIQTSYKVDTEISAGIRITIGESIIDTSFQGQLSDLALHLLARGTL
jgi:F0F1-type ATP synthase delta subunit